MDEPVVSEFSTSYYFAEIAGPIVVVAIAITLACLTQQKIGWNVAILLICTLLVGGYWFGFRTSFMVITITKTDITFYYSLIRKEIVVNYIDIDKIYTNEVPRRPAKYSYALIENLVITLNDGKEVSFNSRDYDNYDELKAAIYKHKPGIGA